MAIECSALSSDVAASAALMIDGRVNMAAPQVHFCSRPHGIRVLLSESQGGIEKQSRSYFHSRSCWRSPFGSPFPC